ncbi:MAG: TetR/AcrR family transcriptional regulator [Sneathiella sp.]|nr:TetR/AcrR family transcriptional regulator [Sneathiella sp.]
MPKKKTREYHSLRRSRQAEQTRAAIQAAADSLFRTKGWSKTTIAAIAREAKVSDETVYAVFGNKRAIIKALIADTVRRGNPGVPLIKQGNALKVLEAVHQGAQIALFARDVTDVLSHVAPLMTVVRTAAHAEPELAILYQQIQEGRRENLAVFVESLMRNGPLQDHLDRESATSLVWRLASPEMFALVTEVEGLSPPDFCDWLEQSLKQLLLAYSA